MNHRQSIHAIDYSNGQETVPFIHVESLSNDATPASQQICKSAHKVKSYLPRKSGTFIGYPK